MIYKTLILLIVIVSPIFAIDLSTNYMAWGIHVGNQKFWFDYNTSDNGSIHVLVAEISPSINGEFEFELNTLFPIGFYSNLNCAFSKGVTYSRSGLASEIKENVETSLFSYKTELFGNVNLPGYGRFLGVQTGFVLGNVLLSSDVPKVDDSKNGYARYVIGPLIQSNLAKSGVYFKGSLLFVPFEEDHDADQIRFNALLGYKRDLRNFVFFGGIKGMRIQDNDLRDEDIYNGLFSVFESKTFSNFEILLGVKIFI